MDVRAVQRRCEAMLDGVEVPSPLDIDRLIDAVSLRRERPVDLVAKNAPLGPCGLWVAMPGRDVVFFEAGTSKVHREHIILHELAHLLCSHRSTERLDTGILRELFPNLRLDMVQRVMGRSRYTAPEEQEAEVMAGLIVHRAGGMFTTATVRRDGPASGVLTRLSTALGGE